MTRHRPTIVVTLPGRTLEELLVQAAAARDAGADAGELRVDRLAPEALAGLDRLFPAALPLVATYRSRAEGGEGSDDAATREEVLLGLASKPFRWIDLELARDRRLASRLPHADLLARIFSVHVPSGSSEPWSRALGELEGVDGIGKLVVPASLDQALRELIPEAARVGEDVVIHTTGPSGPLLRAWARRFGFPLVYAALPEGEGAPVEPSQIPVDRLRPFLDAEEPPPLFAVCGRPIVHSASPAVHSAWMRDAGRSGLYITLEPATDREFLDALGPLEEGGFRGLNVTHPFKAVAAEAADEVGPGTRACGAANCLTFRGGEIEAENTDLLAIMRRLEELRASGRWDGRSVAVVGSGGAARATLAACREVGATPTVYARRESAARTLAKEFRAAVGHPGERAPTSLVVHATDVGRTVGATLDVPLAPLLGPGTHLLDWVYRPAASVVQAAADAASATYEDGWRLLVYQAAASYEIWWGEPPPMESIARTISEGA